MRKRILIALAVLATVFVVSVVGASVLDLSGSDRAPGEGTTEAACATNLTVDHPVSNGGHDNNRITHVDISGDMTKCDGQTIRVEVDLPNAEHAYAFKKLGAGVTMVSFVFDANTGDFTDASPVAQNGDLVAAGNLVGPVKAKDFGLVNILIATSWE